MTCNNPSRKHCSRLSTPVRLGVVAVAACFLAAPALSNPVNPAVVNGAATFNQVGNVLTVTNSNGAIINWDKFSIKAGETTHFAQTSASSSVLNRVLNDPTAIYGTLSSNGRVWLVNPAGIMVGAGGRVDVAGFVASTLNISNENFLAGRNLFVNEGTAKDVINQGQITTPAGGSVYLIGSNVSNEGIITTPKGETILAAGNTVSLIDSALPGVKVDITGAAGNSTNLGTITAEAGRIGIAGVIVRNSGTLNASSVVNEGGRIFLRASQRIEIDAAGRILADGTKGGEIIAKVEDANGISGTLVARGEISAQGDGSKGSGGFVETSAAKVDLRGLRVKTRGGKWLIDPNDITIGADIYGGDIGFALEGGDVTIETAAAGPSVYGGTNGDIFVNEAIYKSEDSVDSTLTLAAERSIEVNAPIIANGFYKLHVNLQARATDTTGTAPGNVGIYAPITTNGGNLWVGGGSVLGGTGQAIGYDANGSYRQRYGIVIEGATISTGGGDVAMYGRGVHNANGDADGIEVLGGINAGGGSIYLNGVGGNNPAWDTSGVYISGSVQTSGFGIITIEGTGGSNTDPWVANRGVRIDGGWIQAENGSISITGTGGGGNSSGNVGILIDPGSLIETTGSGDISLWGYGGGGTGRNHGIYMDGGEGMTTRISSASGSVNLTGTAGGHTDSEEIESSAIRIAGDSTLSAPSGYLSLESLGGNIHISPYDEYGYDYWYDPSLSAGNYVYLTTHGDDVYWGADGALGGSKVYISTTGKNASTAGATGGNGGNVTLESLSNNVTIGGINADGGEGGWGNATHAGGKGGKGGDVSITASNGTITVADYISANGGSQWWNANSEGGDGGSISLYGGSISFGSYSTLSARGGDGGEGDAYYHLNGGKGGKGGSISLTTTATTLSGGDIDFSYTNIDVRGGDGGWGSDSDSSAKGATAGGDGGKGGSVVMVAQNASIGTDGGEGWINASGGNGGDGGRDNHGVFGGANGGNGGDAGSIALTGRTIWLSGDSYYGVGVIASGGNGGNGGDGYNTDFGGTASYTVRNADGTLLCSGASCDGTWVYGGPPGTTTQIALPTSGTNTGTTLGGRGGNGGNAGNALDAYDNPIPNLTLIATDPGGSGIQLLSGAYVESMGGDGGSGGWGRNASSVAGSWYGWYQQTYPTPTVHTVWRQAIASGTGIDGNQNADGGWGGNNGWTHLESQAGVNQPINNSDGSFRTGRLTFPDAEAGGILGSVSFLGQSNYIDSVSGHVAGNFTFDGRGGDSSSQIYNLGEWDRPLTVSSTLLVHSVSDVSVVNVPSGGGATVLTDGSLWTYNDFTSADITLSANWDIYLNGSLTTTDGSVIVAAGRNLTVSGPITSTNAVDLRAGSTYGGGVWSISETGGNLLMTSGSSVSAGIYDDVWLQATGGTDSFGDVTQEGGNQISGANVAVLADRDISLAGTVTAGSNIVVSAGRDLTVSGAIESTGGWVDLRAGSYASVGEPWSWEPSTTGGNLTLAAGSTVTADGDIWLQAWAGEERPGDLKQLGSSSEITSYWGNVTIVADRDISLAGTVSAPSDEGGGEIIVAAGRDLMVSGAVSAYSYVDLEGGVSYNGLNWTPTGLGGDVLLTAASSVISGGDLWISGLGDGSGADGSERVGNVQALGTLEAGVGSSVDIYAWGNLTVKSLTAPSATVYLSAGYDWNDDSDNPAAKTLTLGRIDATGGMIDAFATGAILDGNAFTETNLLASDITLTSTLGGASGEWAISLDVEATNSVTASVGSAASYGGIYVRNWATQPSTVSLTDNAMSEAAVKYFQFNDYDMTLDVSNSFYAGSGDIDITAGRNFIFNPSSLSGTPANLYLTSLTGDLSLSDALSTTGFIGLHADSGVLDISQPVSGLNINMSGSTVNINLGGPVTATEDMVVGGGTVSIGDAVSAKDIILGANALNITSTGGLLATRQNNSHVLATVTGDVSITGGYIRTTNDTGEPGYGDLQMIVGGNLNVSYGGSIYAGFNQLLLQPSPYYYADASIAVAGKLKLTNGGYIAAANDIYLDMLGSTSTVEMSSGGGSPAYILSDAGIGVSGTTFLTFAARTAGGIIIDGKETTENGVGASGFFSPNLSTPGGVKVTYASTGANDLCAISPLLCKGPEDDLFQPPPKPDKPKDKKTSCEEGSFGCEEDHANDGNKDEKPGQRKVAQCSM